MDDRCIGKDPDLLTSFNSYSLTVSVFACAECFVYFIVNVDQIPR